MAVLRSFLAVEVRASPLKAGEGLGAEVRATDGAGRSIRDGRVSTKSSRQSNGDKEYDKSMRIVRFLTLKRLVLNLRES